MCPSDKREVVYTRSDLIPSNEKKYMTNFHIVNHVEKNQEENSHGRKDESRGKKKNNNKSGRGRGSECECECKCKSASTKMNKSSKNKNENESTNEHVKIVTSLPTKEKIQDKLFHSQNTDTTDTELDVNSDIAFDPEIDSEINSQLNTNLEIDSVPHIISELDTDMINNEDSVTSPNSNIVMHPKVIANLNSASDQKYPPEMENTNNPQSTKSKEKRKTIEVAALTMVLRSRSKLLH
jgi:hypothetical protein